MLKNGFGFVDFEDYRDADDAVYELHGRELLGERVIVEHAKGPSGRSQRSSRAPKPTWLDNSRYGAPVRTGYKLIVENLSSRVSWQDLKDYMRQAGDVTFADAHKDRRNEGVVEFASYKDMKRAIDKLDGTEINGRKIKLVEDSRNKSRSRSRSDSRRSRSRGRRSRRSNSRSYSRSASRGRSDSRKNDRKRSESKKRQDDRSVSRKRDRSLSKDRRSHSKDRRVRNNSRRDRKSRSKSHSRNRNESRDRSRSADSRHKNDEEGRRSRSRSERSRSGSSQKQTNRSQGRGSMSRDKDGSERDDGKLCKKERSVSVDKPHGENKSRSHSRSSSRSYHSDDDKAGSQTPDIRKRSRSPESTGTPSKRRRLSSAGSARSRKTESD